MMLRQLHTARFCLVVSLLLATVIASALYQSERILDKKLSDLPHGEGGTHNSEFDHEAFLGQEQEAEFHKLSPVESKRKLGDIILKIDTDKNGQVSEDEMIAWIKYIQRRYVTEDAKTQWAAYDKKMGEVLPWAEYLERTYRDEDLASDSHMVDLKRRDTRRFNLADRDYKGSLTFQEFIDFLHPEEAEHMRDIVVSETMEDMDKNKDGYVDLEEYVADMYDRANGGEEPDWLIQEREHFSEWRDLNSDGRLDRSEIKHWVLPEDYDHAVAESKHLIYEADQNKDGVLSREEILENYSLFVGSQATDFGSALNQRHDEF